MNATLVTIRIAGRPSHHQLIRCVIQTIGVRRQSLASEIFQMGQELRSAPTAPQLSLFRMAVRACFRLERDPIFHAGARGLDAGSVS
jgi:hypothetical protein